MAENTRTLSTFADRTKTEASKIGSAFDAVRSQSSSIFSGLTTGGISGGVDAIQGLGTAFASALGPAGIAVAALAAGFAGIVYQGKGLVVELHSITVASKVLGESVHNTQVLLQALGGDEAQTTLLKFQSHLGSITRDLRGPVANAFREIGLDPEKVAGTNLRHALGETFEALRNVADANDRARLAQDIFGKSYISLAEDIAKGRAAIDRAERNVDLRGFTDEQIRRAEALRTQQREFEASHQTFGDRLKRTWDDISLSAREAYLVANRLANGENPGNLAVSSGLVGPHGTNLSRFFGLGPQRPATSPIISAASVAAMDARIAAITTASSAAADLSYHEDEVGDAIRAANHEASVFLATLERQTAQVGLTAAQIRANDLRRAGASEELVGLIRAQDEVHARAQQELALRRQITQQLASQKDSSLAIVGITAGSLEDAKIVADLQTRRNNPGQEGSPAQVANLLEAVERVLQEQLRISRIVEENTRPRNGVRATDF